jgi:replicative DNA helicase
VTAALRHWAEDAERAVLGCVLAAAALDADAGFRVLRRVQTAGLDAEHFALAAHEALFRLMERMADEGLPIDAVSVAAEVDATHEDPRLVARLRTLACEVPAISACERYAAIVTDATVRREIEERAA